MPSTQADDSPRLRMRWMSPREYARLQGAGDYRWSASTADSRVLFGFGDAVCVPVIRWIDEHVLSHVRTGLRTDSIEAFVKSAAAYSEVAALMLNLLRTLRARALGLIHVALDVTVLEQRAYPAGDLQSTLESHRTRLVPGFRERVQHLVDLARGAGIEPVLLTQPALYGDGHDDATGVDLAGIVVDQGGRPVEGARIHATGRDSQTISVMDMLDEIGMPNARSSALLFRMLRSESVAGSLNQTCTAIGRSSPPFTLTSVFGIDIGCSSRQRQVR